MVVLDLLFMKYLPLLLVLLVACSGPVVDDATTAVGDDSGVMVNDGAKVADAPADTAAPSAVQKVKDFFGQGLALKCEYTVDEADSVGSGTTWVQGDKVRSEGSFESMGETANSLVVMKDDVVYMKNEEPSLDCDWIMYATEEADYEPMEVDEEFTLDQIEAEYADEYGLIDCGFAKAPSGAFDTPGKVCDFEEMMNAQMAAAGIDLSDYQ